MNPYCRSVEENRIFAIVEIVCICYIRLSLEESKYQGYLAIICKQITAKAKEELRQAIRDFLREPLRYHFFRQRFNTYFNTHPSSDFREFALPWLDEVLIWEE